jgi:signal transduction histidine kinase
MSSERPSTRSSDFPTLSGRRRSATRANRYSEYGGFIYQSGHHLLGLIGDILDLAKIESGRKKLTPEPIDVMSLVRDEAERARAKAAEKAVGLAVELPDSIAAAAWRRARGASDRGSSVV